MKNSLLLPLTVALLFLWSMPAYAEDRLDVLIAPEQSDCFHASDLCSALSGADVQRVSLFEALERYTECPLCMGAAAQDTWSHPLSREIMADEQDVLRLVNKEHLLDKAYPDQDDSEHRLVNVTAPVTKGKHQLRAVANDALCALTDAAAQDGVKLYVGSAYRSYRSQEVIHYNHVKKLGYDDGYKQVAGASEHQTGLAADVVSWAYRSKFQQSFGDTEEGIWLREHCDEYGFIIRYPQDKEDITGIRYEPWHIRYVGKEAAAYIMENHLTLEEFDLERQAALSGE